MVRTLFLLYSRYAEYHEDHSAQIYLTQKMLLTKANDKLCELYTTGFFFPSISSVSLYSPSYNEITDQF